MSDENSELEIHVPPEIQARMDADPKLAEIMRMVFANLRQARQAVIDGRYASFEDAYEAITGKRPVEIDPMGIDQDEVSE